MLTNIYIKNFAIIDEQDIQFTAGLNVLSGETGAGKSILIDALGLQLGDRADSSWIRQGEIRCHIQSEYTLPDNSLINNWLKNNEFDNENEEAQCQLRRTLSSNGKSKAYINGLPTTLSNTKHIGEMLVDIHGQHTHQSLTKPEKQLGLLDSFANHNDLLQAVKNAYQQWKKLCQQKQQLLQNDGSLSDKVELLRYQLEEITALNIIPNEFGELAEKQKSLSSGQYILEHSEMIQQQLNGDQGITRQINQLIQLAENIQAKDKKFEEIGELFNQASIYLDEANSSLNKYIDQIDLDPEQLAKIDNRMSELHNLARKHHRDPDTLLALQSEITQQLHDIEQAENQLKNIDSEIAQAEKNYLDLAEKLRKKRQAAIKSLCKSIHAHLHALNLENATFSIELSPSKQFKVNGMDNVLFMFAPNPGQGSKPLHKIASGGELSRVSLAIKVASVAQKSDATLIFDEVDSGVGGATAEVIGRLLKTLAQYNQIICVTHLAQVAAFADNHIKINKHVKAGQTFTSFEYLDENTRLDELARMSGGIKMDKKTQEHAKNLRHNAIQFTLELN